MGAHRTAAEAETARPTRPAAAGTRASAEQLSDRLEAGGHRVFLDARTLKPGDFWDLEIPRALATSRIIVVLIASSYESAHYLRAEIAQVIDRARQAGSPRLVPVYIDGPLPAGIVSPYGLGVVQAIDAQAVGGLGAVDAAQLEGLLARRLQPEESHRSTPRSCNWSVHGLAETRRTR